MYDGLSVRQYQATKEFIEVINERRSQRNAGPLAWNTAVKFLMARKFDIRRALALYEQHEITRNREGLVKLDPSREPLKTELETGKFTILPTRDPSGAAIAIFTACRHFPLVTTHQTTLQGVVYQLDVALDSIETQRCGLVFIYDMTNSKYANFDYDLSQKILTLLKGGYPARLKKVLIVTAPLWFKAPFKILRLFVREKLRDRVYTVNISQLCSHIPIGSLPKDLGGSFEVDHKSWLLRCFKSMANRYSDLCDITSPTLTKSESQETPSELISFEEDRSKSENASNHSARDGQDEISENAVSVSEKLNVDFEGKELGDDVKGTFDSLESAADDTCEDDANGESENYSSSFSQISQNNISIATDPSPTSSETFTDTTGKTVPPSPQLRRMSVGSISSHDDSLHFDDGHGMRLYEFIEHVRQKGRKGLYEDYAEIKAKAPEGTFELSKLKPNLSKNRYTDVLCYDHSRVKLSLIDGDPYSDYINANYVDGYKQKNAFITTQGPLPRTFSDFWRMVWEQQALVVVMTTRAVERGRPKCGQYWPLEEDGALECDHFQVFNSSVQENKDYTYSALIITNTKTEEVREVVHLQFTSWPDYGVPHSAIAMLEFLYKVREYQSRAVQSLAEKWTGHALGPPIIVHCSAGIGRTGTFCTLDICIRRLEDVGTIDVRGTVEKIRSQRAYSIQMPDQYVFCHLALLEYALSEGLIEDVDLTGFNDSGSDSE